MNPSKILANFAFLLVCSIAYVANAEAQKLPEQEILEKILLQNKDYNHLFRPVTGGNLSEPVRVVVNFYVRSFEYIDDVKGEYAVQLTFRQQWTDERLAYSGETRVPYVSLPDPENAKSQVWMPDTFFSNEKEGHTHDLLRPNQYIRIFPDGDVLHSTRISLKLSCPMNLRNFPRDSQTCSMRIANYGFTTRDVAYTWKKVDPVQVSSMISLPSFSLTSFTTDYCDSMTNTGTYSCLRVDFNFNREIGYYMTHVYVPSVMMVMASWIPFWFAVTDTKTRTLFGALTLFVLCIQTTEMNKGFPKVSYTKDVDVWTGICLTFVFAALLQSATVQYLARHLQVPDQGHRRVADNDKDEDSEEADGRGGSPPTAGDSLLPCNKWMQKCAEKCVGKKNVGRLPNLIDGISQIAFPICFVIFACIYCAKGSTNSDF